MRRMVIVLVVCLSVLSGISVRAGAGDTPERMTVAVLFFEDKTSDPDLSYWRYLSSHTLIRKFHEVKSIKVLSDNAVRFGYRQIDKNRGDAIDPKQAGRIGELIEARRVVFGSYCLKGNQWQLEAFVLNTASGKVSKKIIAKSTDWFDASGEIITQVLKELKIKATEKELEKISEKWTADRQAPEYAGKGLQLYEEQGAYPDQEDYFRKAIARDKQFSYAYIGLIAALGSQGRFDESAELIKKALERDPNDKYAYLMSGVMIASMKDVPAAEKSLKKSMSLDEGYSEPVLWLGQLCAIQNKWDDAIYYYQKAIAIDAYDADSYACLGLAYAYKRQRDDAVRQLIEIERLDPEQTINSDQMVFQIYTLLGDLPKAAKYGERFIEKALETGAQPQLVQGVKKNIEKIKASLTPVYLEADIPKKYSKEQLLMALEEKLTKEELKLVVNPLESNKEIDKWAMKLTEGVEGDLDKAKAIFDAMLYRIQPNSLSIESNTRTAKEVFAAWNDTDNLFICQEFAKLYVVLARSVQLDAFAVIIKKQYNDDVSSHMCAGVFLDGKLLLVDPSQKWFGVPHKEFVVLDDLQMAASQLHQNMLSPEESEVLCRTAIKLYPEDLFAYINLSSDLVKQRKWKQAIEAIDKAMEIDPEYYHNYLIAGVIAKAMGDIEKAEKSYRKALEINPKHAMSHFKLGELLAEKGMFKEARDEFRAGLRCLHERKVGERAQSLIIKINEMIGADPDMANKDSFLVQ